MSLPSHLCPYLNVFVFACTNVLLCILIQVTDSALVGFVRGVLRHSGKKATAAAQAASSPTSSPASAEASVSDVAADTLLLGSGGAVTVTLSAATESGFPRRLW
jgi:hypothetical protein